MKTSKGFLSVAILIFCISMVLTTAHAQEESEVEVTEEESTTEESGTEESASEEMENAGTPDVVVIPLGEEEDDESEADGSSLIEIESVVGTQSAISNKIPLFVTVTPAIDSSKAQISWDIPRGLGTDDEVNEWFRMEADKAKTFKIEVDPLSLGTYEVVVDVTAWRYDTNYVSSSTLEFEIDEDLLVTPQSNDYKRGKMMYNAAMVFVIVLILIAAIIGVKFGIKWFRKWMSEE